MAFFDDFTSALKQKWLQYYQVNHSWLALQMELESVKTPDGGRRPPSHLILGILNALEPKLAQLMLPFAKLNPSPDALIDVLELNFDPEVALGNKPAIKEPSAPPSEVTSSTPAIETAFDRDELEEDEDSLVAPAVIVSTTTIETVDTVELSEDAIDELDEDVSVVSLDDDEDVGGLGDIELDDLAETPSEEDSDEDADGFGDLESLDEFAETSSDESGEESDEDFGAALDAWGEETSDESETDLSDMTLDEFGDTSTKELDDEDLDAFSDINFDPFSDPKAKKDDDDDEWSK